MCVQRYNNVSLI